MNEQEIIKNVLSGKIDDFALIVDFYSKKIDRYVLALGAGNNNEDIVQEVFIKAYINLNDYDINLNFSSWLYRIAHNVTVDYFRKNKVKVIDFDLDEMSDYLVDNKSKLIEDKIIEEENSLEINLALNIIDSYSRELLWLSYFENKNYEEISDIFKVSKNKIGVDIFRAKTKLKKVLIKNGK